MPDDRRVLEGIARMVVDGTNVLYALRRSPAPLPPAALIGRLRAIVPPGVAITVVLDGSPEHGLVARQVASGVEVRYAGRFTADELIAHLLEGQYRPEASGTLVVTDDIELSSVVRRSGGRTVRNGWLLGRLERQHLSSPAPGRRGREVVVEAFASLARVRVLLIAAMSKRRPLTRRQRDLAVAQLKQAIKLLGR